MQEGQDSLKQERRPLHSRLKEIQEAELKLSEIIGQLGT